MKIHTEGRAVVARLPAATARAKILEVRELAKSRAYPSLDCFRADLSPGREYARPMRAPASSSLIRRQRRRLRRRCARSQSDPHPGIHREQLGRLPRCPRGSRWSRIDLTSAEIALYATKESDRGITTSEFATAINAQVAINGDAFAVANFAPRGLAMGELDGVDAAPPTTPRPRVLHFAPRSASARSPASSRPSWSSQSRRSARGHAGRDLGPAAARPRRRGRDHFDCADPVSDRRASARRAPRSRCPPTATRCGSSSSTAGRTARSA